MASGSVLLAESRNTGSRLAGKIEWETVSNEQYNNSDLTVRLYVRKYSPDETISIMTMGYWPWTLNIDGVNYSGREYCEVLTQWVLVKTLTIDAINHGVDGNKSVNISGSVSAPAGTSYSGHTTSGYVLAVFDELTRGSTISCTDAHIGSKPVIVINKANSAFTHTLSYSFGSLSGIIVEKTKENIYADFAWPEAFYYEIPNSEAGSGKIMCDTFLGEELIGSSSCNFRAIADDRSCAPIVEASVVDINEATLNATGSEDIMVRGMSNAQYHVRAEGYMGATIVSVKAVNAETEKEGPDGTFENVESGSFRFTVTDSRGIITTVDISKELVQYVKPTCNIDSIEIDADGDAIVRCSGQCFTGSFGEQVNAVTVEAGCALRGNEIVNWVEMNCKYGAGEYAAECTIRDFDYEQANVFQVKVSDRLLALHSPPEIIKVLPVFDWGEHDFNFNVPVKLPKLTIGETEITQEQLDALLKLL